MNQSENRGKNVLIVAAHPDDEVLGMGGTIARHRDWGDRVSLLFMTDGVSSRDTADGAAAERRRHAASAAAQRLGASIHAFGDFPDNMLDSVALLEICQFVEKAAAATTPDLVYTHHAGDLNVDHQLTNRAVLTAFRPQPSATCHSILSFSVLSSTEWQPPRSAQPFVPDTFVDISTTVEDLLAAMACYEEELRPDPHARSLEAVRARVEYMGRTVGVAAAEPFATLRRLVGAPPGSRQT